MQTSDRRLRATIRVGFSALLMFLVIVCGCSKRDRSSTESNTGDRATTNLTLKLGWQPPWANQGQLVAILKNTDLLAKEGVAVEFVPFTYGGPMVEAAAGNRLDVIFAGEQPVLNLISRSAEWRIVARMVRYRSAIVVPPGSTLQRLEELKGKTIATAFGSTTHRDLVRILNEHGLDGQVKLVSLDQAEHAGVIERGGKENWDEIVGIATYDPTIAAAVSNGKARVLYAWPSPGLVAAHKRMIEQQRAQLEGFLRAYRKSYVRYATAPSEANRWYSAESRLPLTDRQYAEIAEFEPNLKAQSEIDVQIGITDELLAQTKNNAGIAFKLGILKSLPDINALTVRALVHP